MPAKPDPRHQSNPPPSPKGKKRSLTPTDMSSPPAKKQSKWTPEEDALIIALRGQGEKWEDISKKLPGRSAISCRLHYQNYLERRSEWDEERKNRLARIYERYVVDIFIASLHIHSPELQMLDSGMSNPIDFCG
jgi:hypothetical protein